ncbi:MAG: cation:proton antiporter [Labilithrix sp.]|nr:cation:proton antiporter [Labilithrix sp.]MCW5815047.1 cation:proton antiporter [Labilithrix sp.]
MEDAHAFLKTLTTVLAVAMVTTVVFHRLKQPVVLGYIIAGLIVGPHVAVPLHADLKTVQILSELGVILLMFGVGLELNVAKLIRVAPTAGVIGVIQIAIMMIAGITLGNAFGWTRLEGVFGGAAIAISSTTIIAKVFEELKVAPRLRELVYGVLIVEDIVAILLLATMTTVSSGDGLDAMGLAVTTGKLFGFLAVMVLLGALVVPRLMNLVVKVGRIETTVVASIGVCFVFAHACAAMHYSVALGAFVAGVLISESGHGHTVEHAIVPVRDMFAAIFFVSVGMLIDPRLVLENWIPVLVLSAVVIVGKVAGVTLGGVVTGCGLRTSVQAGLSLSQIGEFSFIIAGLGTSLGATRPFLFPVAVAVSALTTLTTPPLVKQAERFSALVEAKSPRRVTAFISVYSAWLDQLRATPASPTRGARLRRLAFLLALDAAVMVGLIILSAVLHHRVAATIGERLSVGRSASEAVFLTCAGVVGLPFLLGVVRLSRAIALTVAGTEGAASRPVALVVQLGLVCAVAAACIAVADAFVPPAIGLALIIILGAVCAYAIWRNARRFDVEVRAGSATLLSAIRIPHHEDAHGAHGAPDAHGAHAAPEPVPGFGAPVPITVPSASKAIGRSLGDIDLRARTGAAILALVRGDDSLLLPPAEEQVRADDVIVVVGAADAIDAARALLSEAA